MLMTASTQRVNDVTVYKIQVGLVHWNFNDGVYSCRLYISSVPIQALFMQ